MPDERELLDQLESWLAVQPHPPTILDVVQTGNIEFFAAYILGGFRQATARAVEERERVAWVRGGAGSLWRGYGAYGGIPP